MAAQGFEAVEDAIVVLLRAATPVIPSINQIIALTVPIATFEVGRKHDAVAVMTDSIVNVEEGAGRQAKPDRDVTITIHVLSSHRRRAVRIKGEGVVDGVMDVADKIFAKLHQADLTLGSVTARLLNLDNRFTELKTGTAQAICRYGILYEVDA